MVKKLVATVALVLTVGSCASDPKPDIEQDVIQGGEWHVVRTPGGRTCDLWLHSARDGSKGFGFAAMDCREEAE